MNDMTTAGEYWAPASPNFGARLALIRHYMGWNIKEAAMACGIKPQSWREWELQGRKPRDFEQVCEQVSRHARCDRVWLMTGVVQPGLPDGPGSGTASSGG